MHNLTSNPFRFSALLPVGLLLAGCGGGERLSLGDDDEVPPVQEVLCNGGVFTGDAVVRSQADVDGMLGCEEVAGDLTIQVSDTQSLEPLGSLRIVRGVLRIEGAGSLMGLQALEQVNDLELVGLRSTDLTGLSSLARVAYDALSGKTRGGAISIQECDALQDLRGLENLRSWEVLNIGQNDHLQSLAGLQTPAVVLQVMLQDCKELTDVSALATLQGVGGFVLSDTGIESLEGFRLQSAEWIMLRSNPELRDLDGLRKLFSVEGLTLDDNDRLARIELPALEKNAAITITGNNALLAVPRYDLRSGEAFASGTGAGSAITGAASKLGYLIDNNAELTSITTPEQYSAAVQYVGISNNPKLTTLDLSGIPAADSLFIRNNAALRDVQTSPAPEGLVGLTRVGDLEVVNNPALSTAAFDDLQTFTRTFSGNLDEPTP